MQNLVVFMEPSPYAFDISLKDGNRFLNRFLIDEDAAFELSGVRYLKQSPLTRFLNDKDYRKFKGKENLR